MISIKRFLLAALLLSSAAFNASAIPFSFGGRDYDLHIVNDIVRHIRNGQGARAELSAAFLAAHPPIVQPPIIQQPEPPQPPVVHGRFESLASKYKACAGASAALLAGTVGVSGFKLIGNSACLNSGICTALVAAQPMSLVPYLAAGTAIAPLIWQYPRQSLALMKKAGVLPITLYRKFAAFMRPAEGAVPTVLERDFLSWARNLTGFALAYYAKNELRNFKAWIAQDNYFMHALTLVAFGLGACYCLKNLGASAWDRRSPALAVGLFVLVTLYRGYCAGI